MHLYFLKPRIMKVKVIFNEKTGLKVVKAIALAGFLILMLSPFYC